MEDNPVINITITVCPSENDKAFNKWYDEKHIPFNMRFKGLSGVTRYKSIRSLGDAAIEESPHYLTTYSFQDLETFNKWNVSHELAEASDPELLKELGVGLIWRVQYESIKTWQNISPNYLITLEGIQYPLKNEGKFEEWYLGKFIPDVFKFSGVEGMTCYKFASAVKRTGKLAIQATEYPRIVTLFYFKDIRTADAYESSPQRADLREDWSRMVKKLGARELCRVQYKPMRTWQR